MSTRKITWDELARLIERARCMTREQREAFHRATAQLREVPLVGRTCTGCGGPIMQKTRPHNRAVTFTYSCTCPGGDGVADPAAGREPVPPSQADTDGGLFREPKDQDS